jgi:hypothetical protein
VEYPTRCDEKFGLVWKGLQRGRRGGVEVVPKLENSWRPEKRMKNIVRESDVTMSTEETFEMETMAAGPKPDVQYGLTVVTMVQEQTATAEGVAAAPPRRTSSVLDMLQQKIREELSLPSEEYISLERYEQLPVEALGEALLRGWGCEKGKPIGRDPETAVAPVEYVGRQGGEGLGAAPLPPKENNKKFIKPGETSSNLQHAQQAVALSGEQSKEGCRDVEADGAASSHHGDDPHAQTFEETGELHEQRTCIVCYCNEISILLLPCRHVCLCEDCAARLDACPLCRSPKQAIVVVYMA